MDKIGTAKYLGEKIGILGITPGKEYAIIGEAGGNLLRVIDDSGEDYCYPNRNWEIVNDPEGKLKNIIK